jgi:BASS family bile acid:Na+ symporter
MTKQQVILLALQASILTTVFTFGLQATLHDVLYIVRRPSLLGRSLVAMMVIMPIVAVALALALDLPQPVKIALVALTISPIPPLLPGKEEKAGGDTRYGLGLMAIAGVLSILTVPLSVNLVGLYIGRPLTIAANTISTIMLTSVVLPLAAGLAVRALWPAVAVRLIRPMGLVARVLLLVGAVGLMIGATGPMLAMVGNGTLVAMTAVVILGLAVGHFLGGPEPGHRLVLGLSTASRHPAIALAVAKANFPDEPRLGPTILLYLLVTAIVSIPYQVWFKRRDKPAAAVQPSA